jgi:hypothetical protein
MRLAALAILALVAGVGVSCDARARYKTEAEECRELCAPRPVVEFHAYKTCRCSEIAPCVQEARDR